MLLFCLTAVAIALSGYVYYRTEVSRIQQEKFSEIASIAQLKVDQIVRWRAGRITDARRLANASTVRHGNRSPVPPD